MANTLEEEEYFLSLQHIYLKDLFVTDWLEEITYWQ
jgi:hypothetical protein